MGISVKFTSVSCNEVLFVSKKYREYGSYGSVELQFLLPLLTPLEKLLTIEETLEFYRKFAEGKLERHHCFLHRIKLEEFNAPEFEEKRKQLEPGNFLKFYYRECPYLIRDASQKVIGDGEVKKLVKLEVIKSRFDVSFIEIQDEEEQEKFKEKIENAIYSNQG